MTIQSHKFKSLLLLGLSLSVMTACNDDDDDNNPPGGGDDGTYEVPSTYTFTDENDHNTVSFDGQQVRQHQLDELIELMESAEDPAVALDFTDLKAMYRNNGGNGGGNFSFSSNKALRNKTAVTFPTDSAEIRNHFEVIMQELASVSQNTTSGEYNGGPGTAGVVYEEANDAGPYMLSALGHDYAEWIEKGMMGAVFYNQITSVYLSEDKIGNQVNNSDPVAPENGKYYTAMEHHWDEAFGYFTTSTNFPEEGTDKFWAHYSNKHDAVLHSNERIMSAYLTGRAAIANGDMATKEEMADKVKSVLERVCAGVAIGYMNEAMANFSSNAKRCHELSEGHQFIKNLRYNTDASISVTDVNNLLDMLGEDFYNVTFTQIKNVRDELSAQMSMDDIKDQL